MPTPREPVAADLESLRAVAAACEQTGIQSVYDEGYRSHLLTAGRLLVSGEVGDVRGYAGLVDRGGAAFLTDLFVHPESRDAGHGRALLDAMWADRPERLTSSSQDPRALSGYARYGARPRWPLLYLRVPGTSDGGARELVEEREFATGDAGWPVGRDDLRTVVVPGAVTAVVVPVEHGVRVIRAVTSDPTALEVLAAGLAARVGPSGSVGLAVPGPHPALPDLLGRGARIVELDHWCASDRAIEVVDPTRELPSPSLG